MEAKIPEIEEVFELGEYMALPVRTYSAGMMTRLEFALVTALDPGVLLLDEGIGAGDPRFAERAERRGDDFAVRSRIVAAASPSARLVSSSRNKRPPTAAGRMLELSRV